MSNDITELLTDGQTDGQTERQIEKRAPMSQSQEVREMFHARFDGRPYLVDLISRPYL